MSESKLQNRREFIKTALIGSTLLAGLNLPARELRKEKALKNITILYTNDQHSRIEPFPDNHPEFANMGGFAKRAKLIKQIRTEQENILLLDAGDIFQGTPYFNYYHGELEYKLMTEMGYDAVTLGNHDFDLGIDNLITQMPHAQFPFINCNYNFVDTALAGKIIPHKVFKKNGIKIGVLGVGIELDGLVDKKLYDGIKYNNPIECANSAAFHLKKDLGCDYIICLSHLGYKYDTTKVSDLLLAEKSRFIDLIIGGHTHTFLNEPVPVKNSDGLQVLVTQVGWAGIWLGRLDVGFTEYNKKVAEKGASQKI